MQDTSPETVGFRLSPQQAQPLALERANAVQCAISVRAADAAALRSRLEDVVARHEILRTRLAVLPGMLGPQQVIAAELPPGWSAGAPDATLESTLAAEAAGLDPARGPLLRACLIDARAGEPAVLVLSAAAAVADEESLLAIATELVGPAAGGSEEQLQYADYAEWRHQLLGGDEPQGTLGRAHWSECVGNLPPAPAILFGTASPSEAGGRAAVPVALAVDGERLDACARAAGPSTPELLEAVWHALLLRLTGGEEMLVAGRVDGRAQPDLAGAIGPYGQRAAIRTHAQDATTFAEVLDQVRRERAAAVRWQDYATAEELAALTAGAGIGFAWHDAPPEVILLRPPRERLALALSLHRADQRVIGELRYDPDAVDRRDAEAIVRRYERLLGAVLDDVQAPLSALPITGATEREHLLAQSRSAEPAPDTSVPVDRLFERVAARAPGRDAVAGDGMTLTYGELDRAANRLAHHLRERNDGRAPIGLCLERTPAMVVALLGILKSGAPYLPLNPEHPAARLEHQLREAGARVLVSEASLLGQLPAPSGALVCVDADAGEIATHPETAPEAGTGPGDLAYVMYTSGSTGTPKGVQVTHANLAGYALGILARLGIGSDPELRFGLVSAVSTDLGNTAIFPTLISGGCLHVFSAGAATDAASLAGELGGRRLDALKITPSHLRALLADDAVATVLPRRLLLVGGEAFPWALAARVRELEPGCRLVNHYGPTETTVGCCAHEVEDSPRADAATVPIGTPLPGVVAHVLDARLEPVPPGVPGELCVAGVGVTAGYVGGRPEDQARFATAPDGRRMYRTGDRVRRLRDGALEFQGRLDEQVKIRGFRVEPGEIEAVLREHPAVSQAAVAVQEDGRGGVELVAYLVAAAAPSVEELRAFLGRTLPDYMIPAGFSTLPGLPLTPSGKVDRRALAAAADGQAERGGEYVAPRDELEAEIAAIWQELLGVERVGVTDDFFALGGHSLLVTQAIMRIRRAHGEVPLRALLAAPTVATLADAVRAASPRPG
jgi:amino acid adenylation domain-containing protein